MSSNLTRARRARAALITVLLLVGFATAFAQDSASLRLNDREYFETRGLNVLVFSSQYNGLFFDEKTAGIELIHHGVRTATGGAVRLKSTPEQWDQIPHLVDRKIDRARNTIEVLLRYDEFDFNSRVLVRPEGAGFRITVSLEKPLPPRLEGRAGLNMEFLPSAYFGKTLLVDGSPRLIPLYPSGPIEVKPADTQIRQFEGYTTFDDRGRKEYVEPAPIAVGKTLVLAPEDPERRVTIKATSGELRLLDGRNVAQNGWFVLRSTLPANATGTVAEWFVQPDTIPGWTRAPVVGFSQVGYHPRQKKVAVVELDPNDTPPETGSIFEVAADGAVSERLKPKVQPWGSYLRYKYATLDFSSIDRPGLYYIQYGTQRTETFPIGPQVYDGIWHLTHDVFFPVQMDHMRVNEAYRVWHGVPHMDDALQAPVNIQHFDGYRMGATTETRFKPGERIPGLAVGGWFDAGDFDIQTLSHAAAIMHLVDTWESFKPTRDETLIDQATRYVDIHRPDGKTDILQQIEHGALQVAAQHRVFGRGIRGIVDPHIHQYTHLGDASTQTDGLLYDPSLGLFDVDGNRSGLPDDRWAFTARTPVTNYGSIGSLAAAARALSGYNTTFANECLALARKAYAEERQNATPAPNAGFEGAFRDGAEMSAVLQLLKTTKDTEYAARFQELVWPALDRRLDFNLLPAVRALPLLDDAYKNRLRPYIVKYKDSLDALEKQNPYGVPIGTGGWAGNGGVIGWATTNYFVHKAFPDLIGPEYTLRGLEYILGRHPASNISFVSGVGARSKKVAYGSNRADFSFIAGGVVPGVLILKPDFPENKEDWPFLWGENEYVIGIAGHYIFLAHAAAELVAGAPQAGSTAVPGGADNTREATEQDHRQMMEQLGIKALRPGPSGNEQAPNHANYDEALANPFPNLPDPLTTKAGHKVATAEAWWKERRPEIVEDFEREVYGRVPSNVPSVTWTVVNTVEETVGGLPVAGRRLVGHVDNSAYPAIKVDIDLVVVTPRQAKAPVPLMMMFRRGVLPGEPPPQLPFKLPPGWEGTDPPATEQLIAAGWGYAFLNPGSVQADNGAGLTKGIIGLVNKGQPRKPDDWGALRAWAWGASRALDHLETDRTVDATRVGVEGVSRFGKAALVTMAFDTRFAVGLIASSGEGGTKLHRRNFGEMVENLTGSGGYHWMAGNFLKYGSAEASFGSKNAGDLPVDSHELLALCAPRLVFISHGIPEKGDARWLDHQGSFMAAVAAGRVYRLLGAKDLGTSDDYMKERMPPVNVGLLEGDLAWRQHDAGHSDGPNWRYFIPWALQKMGSG